MQQLSWDIQSIMEEEVNIQLQDAGKLELKCQVLRILLCSHS